MVNHPQIEYLVSNHNDTKEDRLPKDNNVSLKMARFVFSSFGVLFPRFFAKIAYKIFATPRWRARHLKTDALIEAAKVSDFPFKNQTVKVYEWGETNRPIVLLAHGWESRGTALRMYVKPLLERRFRIIAFDALGHGDSTGKQNNLPTNAQTIAALIHHYGSVYACIGHSFGCSSTIFAMQNIDKTISIDKLVFIAAPPKTLQVVTGVFSYLHIPKKMQNAFIQHLENLSGYPIENLGDIALAEPFIQTKKLLLIHDERDNVTSIEVPKRIINHWEKAKLLVTNGYGHFRLAKNPDVIERVIDFILH